MCRWREVFTVKELFGESRVLVLDGNPVKTCKECGAIVAEPAKHVDWHNKVADL